MEVLHQPPPPGSFVPLAEHQSRTPESFYDGPPILHHLSEGCKIVTRESELRACPALAGLRGNVADTTTTNGGAAADEEEDQEVVIDGVNVWVTSEKLILFSAAASSGLSIPYPSISLHAIQRLPLPGSSPEPVQGLYMQLGGAENPDGDDDDVEEESISLTIIPQSSPSQPTTAETAVQPTEEEQEPSQTPTEALYASLSACSNLHPDIAGGDGEGDDQDQGVQQLDESVLFQNGMIFPGNNAGGLPPAMPGSGGWITADNVHEYFDEEGNWKGDNNTEGPDEMESGGETPLGPGAGTVRTREEESVADPVPGPEAEEEDTKWRRTG